MTTKSKSPQKVELSGTARTVIQAIWLSLMLGFIIAASVFMYISSKLIPDTEKLENPNYEIASVILAEDLSELGKAFTLNREWISFEELNPHIVNGLIATEDERFYSHSGIDFRSTLRAIIYLSRKGGASTITQQLGKLFYTQRSSSFIKRSWQKLKEWVIAVELERRYTKEEIIAMYLNKHDFIYGANGVAAAAKTYFGKDQSQLEPDEAAILVGMLKNPVVYNPVINPELANSRKAVVLRQMVRNKFLSKSEAKDFIDKPVNTSDFRREIHYDGVAPYFRAELVKWLKDLFESERYKKPDGTKYNPFTDGLKIYTTIDKKMQIHAEKAMEEHMKTIQKRYFQVWKDKDPWIHNATKEQKEIRNNTLLRQMRQSDRYRFIRNSVLNPITNEIAEEIPGSRFLDADIFRLFRYDGDKNEIKADINKNMISKSQAEIYEKVLKSEFWPKLKNAWEDLRKKADQEFSKPVKMVVFDYETGGDKTVTMSPYDSIKFHQQHLQIGSIGVDPGTGYVKTWIGGINHKYFQFDHVRSKRQVGSTFKPFIYATAIIDNAMSPCHKVQDVRYCIPAGDPNFKLMETWCPNNADGKFSGEWLTLKEALAKSTNSVSVYLMKEIGNVELVRNLLSTLNVDISTVPPSPSICLGTAELSAYQMATAYTAFANGGIQSNPIFVTKIEDKNGRVIYSAVPEQKKAINESYNHVIVDLLRSSAQLGSSVKSVAGGKTGTTNDYKDGWFMGFTPELVVATWVGGSVEWIRFTSLADGQGSRMAKPFYRLFMQRIEEDSTIDYNVNATFKMPSGELIVTSCEEYDRIVFPDGDADRKKKDEFGDEFGDEF